MSVISPLSVFCNSSKTYQPQSYPKSKRSDGNALPLFPISAAPTYPTAQQIGNFISKSKITNTRLDTRLSEEDIEMLLNILVLDGEIEKVYTFYNLNPKNLKK